MKLKNVTISLSLVILILGITLGIQIEKVFSSDSLKDNLAQ